jgi:glycosyltransferase involved in cell wall biosynthesis
MLERAEVDAVIAHDTLFLQDVLAARWPTLWIATGGDVPYARCDAIWVPAELVGDGTRARAAANGNPEILARQLLFTLPQDAPPADRAELGLPSDAVVLLSIGTRLASEIDVSFRTVVTEILRAEPSAWLLLVGPETEPMPAQFDADIRARVRGIGLHESPRALYRSCDVYLNPFRSGGGTSAQTAMADGMPIVTLAAGDVGAVAGVELAVADKARYRDHLLALVRDPQLRAASSDRSRARIAATFDFPAQVAEIIATLQRLAATPR